MQTIARFFEHADLLIYINMLVFVVILAFVVERVIFLMLRGRINSRLLFDQLRKLVQANNVDRAIRLCGSNNAPLLRVAKAGLVQVHRGEEAIATSVEEALVETTPDVKKRISALWSLANIATLVGLLGTVWGLITSFSAVSSADPAKRQEMLSLGISQALHHTALGLGIALIAILSHLVISGLAKKVTAELEIFSMKLENFLVVQSRTKP